MKKKNRFADWLIELANRSFGLSTDASLKSVKKFLDKKVRTCNSRSRSPTIPQSFVVFYFTMFGSQIDLYFSNRLPNYLASAREAYKSLACRNSCTITLLLLWPDTGQNRRSAKTLISRWKQRQKNLFLSFVILRTK